MKNKISARALPFLLVAFLSCQGHGIDSKAGTTAFSFLKIGIGARASGMGDSFTGVANDASTLYWNPAGIAQVDNKFQATFMHNSWLEGLSYEFIGGIFQFSQLEMLTFGASLLTSNSGNIDRYDVNDSPSGSFNGSGTAFAVSAAKTFVYDMLYAGVTLKTIQEKIEDSGASTFAIDIGGLYKLSGQLMLGACIQNLGSGVKFVSSSYSLPLNIKGGISYKSGPYSEHPYVFAADMSIPADNTVQISLGFEYTLNMMLDLRGGYKLTLGGADLGGLSGISAGIGGKFTVGEKTGLLVDYAISPYGEIGLTNRLSATLKF